MADPMAALLPLSDAWSRLFALAPPPAIERVSLIDAAGRWTADDVRALRTQPSADLSAMDGYAIRFADLPGPWRVIGESAAGRGFAGAVNPGEAVRIFTGAPLPPGTDTVMVQEEAARDGDVLRLDGEGPAMHGRNVRRRGLDFSESDWLVRSGERLTPARLALIGAAGHGSVAVHRKVRVAIVATGDELVAPGAPVGATQLPETNRLMLAAQLADLPVTLVDLGILPDRRDALEAAFRAVDADLLVTSGGASVGDHDLVRPALEAAGAVIDFWKIALRPGKPVMAGRLGGAVVLGLPGNPVSAFVTTLLFVRPLIAHLAGAADPLPRTRTATLAEPLGANGERTDYLRAELHDGRVTASTLQDSAMLRTLARATCLIVREPHAPAAHAGDSVEILDLA
ncbi:molybdopterin molybdotransferase [Sphingomonas naasensis]|uniref:Molybdopterin molybdenumtransferase n=1 Tax=Sphingomonas naasensis TaxID=1344951 RepID=A0A4S1WUG5_9SPHN|nr:gephyrin-like molybdotransferase Glp [Sphingomonas naasensis]NIJ18752.1 molybdopterin molybdotransferase [Sphingomonas naasensis]TGX45987.1 molybdopterin molybdotransferase MoeA [Sphingomonas naasensis]